MWCYSLWTEKNHNASSYIQKQEYKGWSLIVLGSFRNSKVNGAWITVDLQFETASLYTKFASLALT